MATYEMILCGLASPLFSLTFSFFFFLPSLPKTLHPPYVECSHPKVAYRHVGVVDDHFVLRRPPTTILAGVAVVVVIAAAAFFLRRRRR